MRDTDQLIAEALRDIAAEAGPPGPVADAAWRAGRRRRAAMLAGATASVVAAIAIALSVVLPPAAAPGLLSPPAGPGLLVSITLTPRAPASTGVLAATAQLLDQRAAHLHLPHTQARVSGPDVVLTGPAADQTQLEALAVTGVLNFRQVLLYQPYHAPGSAATAYGDASLVNQHTLALFHKLVCTPYNTSNWMYQVGYTTARDHDNPATQIVSCDSNGTKYALDAASVRGTQIRTATAGPSTTRQWIVTFTFNRAGASAFGTLTSRLYNKYYGLASRGSQNGIALDSIAFVLDGNVITAPEIDAPITAGVGQIPGNFTRTQAQQLAAILQSGALPVDFQVSAIITANPAPSSQRAAFPG